MKTPKGKAWAHFLIDYGPEADIFWVCFLDENGESWTFSNREISMQTNITLGRKTPQRLIENKIYSSIN